MMSFRNTDPAGSLGSGGEASARPLRPAGARRVTEGSTDVTHRATRTVRGTRSPQPDRGGLAEERTSGAVAPVDPHREAPALEQDERREDGCDRQVRDGHELVDRDAAGHQLGGDRALDRPERLAWRRGDRVADAGRSGGRTPDPR